MGSITRPHTGWRVPRGRSLWDRLPKELREHILAAASPFARLLRGDLLFAELQCLPLADKHRLWAQALASGWQGDFGLLPPVDGHSECFLAVRDEATLARVWQAGLINAVTHQRIVIRNGWRHLVNDIGGGGSSGSGSGDLASLQSAAAFEGSRTLLEHATSATGSGKLHPRLADFASEGGHLEIVELLFRGRCTSMWAMPAAAAKGHVHVVRWCRERGLDHAVRDAWRLAAAHGHADVLAYLLRAYPKQRFAVGPWELRHLSSVPALELLSRAGAIGDTAALLGHLARAGSTDCVRWLCQAHALRPTQDMLLVAAENNHAQLVRWLLRRPRITATTHVILAAIHRGSVDALGALVEHSPQGAHLISTTASETNDIGLMQWCHLRCAESVSQSTLHTAIVHNSTDVIEYLIDHVHEYAWNIAQAIDVAAAAKMHHVVQFLAGIASLDSDCL
ncbi:hypothetical protein HK105_201001 [Polyrhizophydium stewartii]|uniref:Ankyrin repeat protein n=1 Tax=Polyrhizophydium stewartii TaxID=2732419 RepID=A0ABR4NIJ9_9FUNG